MSFETTEPLDPAVGDRAPISMLASMRAEIEQATFPDTRLEHPTLPGYVLTFRSLIDADELDAWRRRARKPTKKDELIPRKFNSLILAGTNTGISKNGALVLDDDEQPVTFTSKQLMATFDVSTAADCAWEFIRNDAHVASLANAVLAKAGFGEDAVEAADNSPT